MPFNYKSLKTHFDKKTKSFICELENIKNLYF